ncbi:MAG TPA: winged helix-turn-helix domain-containing protein [Actinomycetes bacterium]
MTERARETIERRPATADEAKAMAHPLRLRALRLCLDQELTNKELAERLGKDPGTLLYHVRILVKAGFLAPGETRHGAHGALEKPYRATGKSWTLNFDHPGEPDPGISRPMLQAFLEELAESGPGAMENETRLGLTLGEASLAEFLRRLTALFDEFVERSPEPGGTAYGLYLAMHRHSRDGANDSQQRPHRARKPRR